MLLSPGAVAASGGPVVDAQLRQLAARAKRKTTWPRLHRYAARSKDPEQRGLAYFVLGYRQYEAGRYPDATVALRQAAAAQFSLADFAEYYWAAAAEARGRSSEVIEILQDFGTRHAQSALCVQALELLARAFLRNSQPERAIQALTAEPRFRHIPSLALLLAQAYGKGGRPEEAAGAYQDVYYAFPTSPESNFAADALHRLEAQLGPSFPQATEEAQTTRAEIFFSKSETARALAEYELLIRAHPASSLQDRWKLRRARCLFGLKQAPQAIQDLEALTPANPEVDAERRALLVEAYARAGEAERMLRELDGLRELYPESPSYAPALSWAASFFARRGDWENAARYDQILAERFPHSDLGREGNWRLAWSYYLTRQNSQAGQALLEHVTRFPDSPHIPAALYWLGRLAEDRESTADPREIYEFLDRRFAHSYYALLARHRLEGLPPSPAEAVKPDEPPQPLSLAVLEQIVPPLGPYRVPPCAPLELGDDLCPCVTLQALSLGDLVEQCLKAELSDHPGEPDLLLVLGRLKRQQRDYSAALESAKKLVPDASEYDFAELPEEVWEMLYPQAFRRLVEAQARANRISPYLVMALIRQESSFNPRATSWANARGLMQVLPETAGSRRRSRRLAARKLYEPAYNIRFGCRYLRGLLRAYNGNVERALAAYNAGTPSVRNWLEGHKFREPGEFVETIPIPATRGYVKAVLRDAEIYRQLMTRSAKFKKCS
jgi:peptidoglycan lytic transglycosylase